MSAVADQRFTVNVDKPSVDDDEGCLGAPDREINLA